MKVISLFVLSGLLAVTAVRADVAYPAKCSITLDANGGSVSRRSMNYSGRLSTLGSLPVPTRSGYVFKYWTMVRNDPTSKVGSKTSVLEVAERGTKTGPHKGYTAKATLYAYWGLKPPKPSATDGKYSGYVKVTWPAVPGAVKYKVRRAMVPDYGRAETIATMKSTKYKDRVACEGSAMGQRYYYWIVPYDARKVGTKKASAYDKGHARLKFTVVGPSWVYVGETAGSQVAISDPCTLCEPRSCKWKISSGTKYASVNSSGEVRGKKKGKATMKVTFAGLTVKLPIYVVRRGDPVPTLFNEGHAYSK